MILNTRYNLDQYFYVVKNEQIWKVKSNLIKCIVETDHSIITEYEFRFEYIIYRIKENECFDTYEEALTELYEVKCYKKIDYDYDDDSKVHKMLFGRFI